MTVFTPRDRPPSQFKLPTDLRTFIENQGIDGPVGVEHLRKFAQENALPVKTCDYRTGCESLNPIIS